MGYYEDHIKAVAERRSANFILLGEAKERKALKRMGWDDAEVDMIIDLERKRTHKD